MTHDKLFKEFMRRFLPHFMRLFFSQEAAQLDFTTLQFSEQEFNVNIPSVGQQRADVIAKVATLDGETTQTIIIHVEVEAYADSIQQLGRRMHDYYVLLRLREEQPILPILLVLLRGGQAAKWVTYEERLFDHTIVQFTYGHVGLPKLVSETFLQQRDPVGAALAVLMRSSALSAWELKLQSMTVVATSGLSNGDKHFLMGMIDQYMPDEALPTPAEVQMAYVENMQELRETWFSRAWREAQEVGVAQGLEKGLQKGLQKGLEEGRKEGQVLGKLEGRRAIVIELLEVKFGKLSTTLLEKVNAIMDEEHLVEIGRAVLSAESLNDLPL